MPDFTLENQYNGHVCGIDEVGRGPLAGPVVAACVIIPPHKRNLEFISELRDSKTLNRRKLEYLESFILEHCHYGIAECSPQEIDEMNILQASLKAMERACLKLFTQGFKPDHALVDGIFIPKSLPCPASAIKKGDNISSSISAAAIIAKIYRDRIMEELHEIYPYYGWKTNVGYPSAQHRQAISAHGITPYHRKSFAPVKSFLENKAA